MRQYRECAMARACNILLEPLVVLAGYFEVILKGKLLIQPTEEYGSHSVDS